MNLFTLLKKPFFSRYQRPWSWPAEAADEQGRWERIHFDSGRRGRLVGLFGEASGGPARGTVVCAHPMCVEAKGFFLKYGHGRLLRDSGFHVLLFDFNGFGESSDVDLLYPDDVLAAARAARARAPGSPVFALGASFGASWTLCALGQPGHGIEAAVLECPFTTLEEFWRPYKVAYAVLRLSGPLLPQVMQRLRPAARARDVQGVRRLLFAYSATDKVTPVSMGERLAEACPLPPEARPLWVSPEGKHTRLVVAAPDVYRDKVLGCFDPAREAASGARGAAPAAREERG